jgi:hypothetical protein
MVAMRVLSDLETLHERALLEFTLQRVSALRTRRLYCGWRHAKAWYVFSAHKEGSTHRSVSIGAPVIPPAGWDGVNPECCQILASGRSEAQNAGGDWKITHPVVGGSGVGWVGDSCAWWRLGQGPDQFFQTITSLV